MSRFLVLVITSICAGCAGVANRELGSAEIRSLASDEIRQCCSGFTSEVDLTIEKTPDGWRVEAPSTCPKAVAGASTFTGTSRSVDDIEQTTILCTGGGASLLYDKKGKLVKLIKWQ
ncbi:hypothetical protein LVB87_03280 [Lysobacter sp. KIS68-7]|uniref:hypothetical protein n=1 Tax=Lysobacter sp. KIS68-7 TaxID=2904252 RepID=UPI001E30C20A|nr:hypothetical protein [Lysobacter sp. KIS68-7]UHQ20199.1 hypothetical protein LVB87_03280 [Lysobacter sp. KIS68-7]